MTPAAGEDVRVGVDTGGTFTDLVATGRRGILAVLKIRSTPEDPARAVCRGLEALGLLRSGVRVVHGTTVATNALLQRSGGKAALVTTEGFEDVLILGRQTRPLLYALDPPPRRPLLQRERRIGAVERCGPGGEVIVPLAGSSVKEIRRRLRGLRVDSVAVCLLHAYANPSHEIQLGRALAKEGWHVSLSHRVSNEFREYERTCTTVANALLARPLESYLAALERKLGARRLKVMASSGGWISSRRAAAQPIRTVLSGPAGGALAAMHLGRLTGNRSLITLDMGGTSTDLSLCDGEVPRIHGTELDGIPLRIPTLDIQSVGAGGGSIARKDAGGALRVGPRSAGADPGPACYARGGKEATLTDAHLYLGRLPAEGLLDGEMPLDRDAAEESLRRLGSRLGMSPEATALGIVRVADAALERAVRRISAGRGRHPAGFALLVFGGAGGLHACSLARSLGIRRILVPPDPGAFSALGLCLSPPTWEVSRTFMLRGTAFAEEAVSGVLARLEREAASAMRSDGHPASSILLESEADLRYRGQSHELTVPVSRRLAEAFHAAHQREYGYCRKGAEIELVNLRVRALAPSFVPSLKQAPIGRRRGSTRSGRQEAILKAGRKVRIPVVRRSGLAPAASVPGPALILEYSATTYVAPGFVASRGPLGILSLRQRGVVRS